MFKITFLFVKSEENVYGRFTRYDLLSAKSVI